MNKPTPSDYAIQVLIVLRIILRHRKDTPIKGTQISEITSLDEREIAKIAGLLGRQGFAVCSGANGYYYAGDEAEWKAHLKKEHDRAMALLSKVSEAQRNHVSQCTLFEGAIAMSETN